MDIKKTELQFEITIAVVVIPLRPIGDAPRGFVRLLISEEERTRYDVLAGRLEFPSGHINVASDELKLAGGDVILGIRDGHLEDVLVQRLSPGLDELLSGPVPFASMLAVDAIRCVRSLWQHVASTTALAESLLNHELRSVRASVLQPGLAIEGPWTLMDENIDVAWITV